MKTPEQIVSEYNEVVALYKSGEALSRSRSKYFQRKGVDRINLANARARQLSSEAGKVRKRVKVLKKQRKKGYPRTLYTAVL